MQKKKTKSLHKKRHTIWNMSVKYSLWQKMDNIKMNNACIHSQHTSDKPKSFIIETFQPFSKSFNIYTTFHYSDVNRILNNQYLIFIWNSIHYICYVDNVYYQFTQHPITTKKEIQITIVLKISHRVSHLIMGIK